MLDTLPEAISAVTEGREILFSIRQFVTVKFAVDWALRAILVILKRNVLLAVWLKNSKLSSTGVSPISRNGPFLEWVIFRFRLWSESLLTIYP